MANPRKAAEQAISLLEQALQDSEARIAESLLDGRNGQMPAYGEFLGEDKIHVLSAYVYSLSN